MKSTAIVLIDPNQLRAAAFAAFLGPWARRSDIDLHVIHDLDELAGLPEHEAMACVYPVGGQSLRDPVVAMTVTRLLELYEGTPLVVFSDRPDAAEISSAIERGLRGFIPTTMSSHVALAAIQFILNGGTYHPHTPAGVAQTRAASTALIHHIGGARDGHPPRAERLAVLSGDGAWPASPAALTDGAATEPRVDHLTKRRHLEVLEFLARGETNKEIARHLNLTEATIKVYVRELMRHFGAKNRMQVALKASVLAGADGITPPDARESFAMRAY